ncbi:hypothetical protein SUNI508_03429 [Seiridium unicorne]|uniref:Major facilitator superfamily (MFS) profile domain-containing protein n=1 Tax=Seiridium unicorne TaxID=138068 RepID=A0ABR2VCA5_9PEZI
MSTSDINPASGAGKEIEPQSLAQSATTTSERPDLKKEVGGTIRDGQHTHIDESIARKTAANIEDFMTLVNEADEVNNRERDMKLSTAFKTYPKAIGWSVILSSYLIMEGYGTSIVGSYSRMDFRALGLPVTILSALIAITGFNFFPFFAESLTLFLIGEFCQGLAWGVFQTMTVAYAVEVCPVPLRHYLTTYVNLCWIIEQFIASGVLVGLVNRSDDWGIPFALQWIWPIPIGIGCILAPESPWWCVRHGRREQAERSLKRLARSSGFLQRNADAAMALMTYTDEMEKQVSEGTRYRDCFKGTDLRRTEIVCMTWLAQTMSGTVVGGLGAFFYQQAGISSEDSFKLG